MKSILFGAALTLTGISLATTGAEAKGCIKGALVGGVAGAQFGAAMGTRIAVTAVGQDAEQCLDAIEALLANRFGEDE